MKQFEKILEFELLHIGEYKIQVYTLVVVFLILIVARILLWLIRKALYSKKRLEKYDRGSTYALYQIIKYFVWVIAIAFALESAGVKLTVFIAGSAALLVGVGMGLQQTFNDIVSGFILLTERSIKINDILEIDGDIVEIKEIGLRTSKGYNRDDISIIIPNSLITTSKVINWSHQTKIMRFRINVGVAYGSDVEMVIKVLQESALEHPDVSKKHNVEARLIEFNNSSLDFQLLFFSEKAFRIEKVKSDIRRIINRKFRENGIQIPFPQLDVHLKNQ